MAGHPEEILIDHGSVDHEEVVIFRGAVGDEIVDDAALVIEHERVLALAGFDFGDVVGEHPIEPDGGGGAADEELPHVGNVKDAGFGADGVVLIDD